MSFDSTSAGSSLDVPRAPSAPPPPPIFGAMPGKKKPQAKGTTPTFLGTGDIPQSNPMGKTLLGQ